MSHEHIMSGAEDNDFRQLLNSEFLDFLGEAAPVGTLLWTNGFAGNPNGSPAWGGNKYDGGIQDRNRVDRYSRLNSYFCTAALAPVDGKLRRRKDNFKQLLALVVDDASPDNLSADPSWVLNTSPGKQQVGFLLDGDDADCADPQLVSTLVNRLATQGKISGDKSGNNIVRYVRLPQGENQKPRDSGPFKVQLAAWNPGVRYSLEDAAGALGIDLDDIRENASQPEATTSTSALGGTQEEKLEAATQNIIAGNDLHDSTNIVAASLVASGAHAGTVVNMLRAMMAASKAPRDERWQSRYEDIPRAVETAYQKFQPPMRETLNVRTGEITAGDAAESMTIWPELQSLDHATTTAEPYPIDALPDIIGDAVREYQAYGQQPVALVACSALSVVALTSQGLANVARDNQLTGPISLNFLIVAQSGERKTAADNAFAKSLTEWERDRKDAMQSEILAKKTEHDAWAVQRDALLKKAARDAGKIIDGHGPRQQLLEHAELEPSVPVAPRLRYEDVNPQSLAYMLANGHPSAALWSDEGGMVTGSHGMKDDSILGFMSLLNRTWDGKDIHQDRKSAGSVHVEGRRLGVSLMVQPLVFQELTQRAGGMARGSGFLARYLMTYPVSTMGTRPYQESARLPHLETFHRRSRELLDVPLPLDQQGRLNPPLLTLSAGAKEVWRRYHDAVEHQLGKLGDLHLVCDFAAKSADNAARIAACFHIFAGGDRWGAINSDLMQRATHIAYWHLREALRLHGLLDEPQERADARLLEEWLSTKSNCPLRDVLTHGPSQVRRKDRRDHAVNQLVELGRYKVIAVNKSKVLVRNPLLDTTDIANPATSATAPERAIDQGLAEIAALAVAKSASSYFESGTL